MKLEILGNCIQTTSMRESFFFGLFNFNVSRANESSASIFKSKYGMTPMTGIPVYSSSHFIPFSSISIIPLNLLIIIPFTSFRSSSSSNARVPTMDAKTPPRSISATRNTSALSIFATRMLAISRSFKLISAGLPAPSATIIS